MSAGYFRFDEPVRDELRSHWPVLVVAFTCMLFGMSAANFSLPFVFKPVIQEFGWGREQAALIATVKFASGAVAALIVGGLLDRISIRLALVISTVAGALALIGFLWINSLIGYYLAGLLLGLSSVSLVVSLKVLVSRTFHAAQGTALGIMLLGSGLGSVVYPIFVTAAMDAFGWRSGMAAMSLGVWVVALPILFLPFFARVTVIPKTREAARPAPTGTRGIELANMRKFAGNRSFWCLTVGVFLAALVDQGFTQHQVLILSDAGYSASFIALCVSALGLIGMAARVIVGNLLDARSTKGGVIAYLSLGAAALLAFAIDKPLILFLFIAARAIGHAIVLIDTAVFAKHAFGTRHYGALIGYFTAINSLGYATGPWLMGHLFDSMKVYDSAYVSFAVLSVVAAIALWFVTPVFWASRQTLKEVVKTEAQSGV